MEKRFITFETVSEPIESDMEQWTVKPLFTRIFGALVKQGAEVIEPPTEWDSYGWYADFRVRSARLTCMMQRSDSWLLIISSNRSLMDRLKGRHYEAELSGFAELVMAAVQKETGVPVKLYNSEAEFRGGSR